MKYILSVCRIACGELHIKCTSVRFCEEEYLMRLSALLEDISNLPNVSSTQHKVSGDLDCIVIESSLIKEKLLKAMEFFFSRDFCYIRYVDLVEQ